MNEQRHIGLLEQLEIACFRPKKYNQLLDNKKSRRWLYMIVVACLLVLIESVIPIMAWDVSVGGLKNFIKNGLPAFEITSKGLTIEDNIEIDVAGVARVIVDPSKESFTSSDVDNTYASQILISKSNALFISSSISREVKFSTLGESVIDNDALVSLIPMFRVGFGIYLIMLLISKIFMYLFWAIIFAFCCRSAVRTTDGRKVTMAQAFEVSFYARTLSAVIMSVNTCLGGYIDESILFIASIFLIMGYIRLGEMSVLNNGEFKTES